MNRPQSLKEIDASTIEEEMKVPVEQSEESRGSALYTRDGLWKVLVQQLALALVILGIVPAISFAWQTLVSEVQPSWSWNSAVELAREVNEAAASNLDVLVTVFIAGAAATLMPYVSDLLSRSDQKPSLKLPKSMGGVSPNWVRNVSFFSGVYLMALLLSALVETLGHESGSSRSGDFFVLGPILVAGIVLCAAGGRIGSPLSGLQKRADQLEEFRTGIRHLAPKEPIGRCELLCSGCWSVLALILSSALIALIPFLPDFSSASILGSSYSTVCSFVVLATVEIVYLSAFLLSSLLWSYFHEADGHIMHWVWILIAVGSLFTALVFAVVWVPEIGLRQKAGVSLVVVVFALWVVWQTRQWKNESSQEGPPVFQVFARLSWILTGRRIASLKSTIKGLRDASRQDF